MSKALTNLWTYVIVMFLIVVAIGGIQSFASNQLEVNDKLSDDSTLYIAKILDIDLSNYSVSKAEIEENGLDLSGNSTGSSLKDFAIEFFYTKSQAEKLSTIAKNFFSLPEYFSTLLAIPTGTLDWILTPLNVLWTLSVLIAGIYFIRGVVT